MATKGILNLRIVFEINRMFMELEHEINAPIMNTFLGVALWGEDEKADDPLSIRELATKIGLAETTVSRHLRYLGDQRRIGVEGLGLVELEIHPVDRRQRIVKLTRKGRNLRERLLYLFGEDHIDDSASQSRSLAS